MPRRRNDVLRSYFQYKNEDLFVCCNENCTSKKLKAHAGNLLRHLRKVHPALYASYAKTERESRKNISLRSFFETQNKNLVLCKNGNCINKVLKSQAGNLLKHLQLVHPALYESYVKKQGNIKTRGSKYEAKVMPRMLQNLFETQDENLVVCKNENCAKVLTAHSGNLQRHLENCHPDLYESYVIEEQDEEEEEEEVTTELKDDDIQLSCIVSKRNTELAFIELFTKCGRPLCMAEDRPFKYLIKPLVDALNINMNAHYIMEKIIEFSCSLKKEISEELRGKLIALKVDTATRSSMSVLGIHVQYIKDDSIIIKTLAMKELTQRPESDYLKSVILEVLREYDIKLNQILAITTDNGDNIVKTSYDFNDDDLSNELEENDLDNICLEDIKNIRCGVHILKLCWNDAMKNGEFKEKVERLRSIAKNLETQSEYLNRLKMENHKMPISDNSTSWNSTYLMLERLMELKEFMNSIKVENKFFDVANDIWDFVGKYLQVFKIIYTASKRLESEQLLYSDLYIQLTNVLLQLQLLPPSEIKSHLTESIQKQKSLLLENELFVTAVFFDPRIKVSLTVDQNVKAKEFIMQLHARLFALKDQHSNHTTQSDEDLCIKSEFLSASPSPNSNNMEDALEEYLKSLDQSIHNAEVTPSRDIENDLFAYGRQRRLGIKENIIDFWNKQGNTLSELAKAVLGIPCTQISAEGLYSALGEERNQLSSTNLEHILLVKANADFNYE